MGARKPPRLGSGLGTLGTVLLVCSVAAILVGLTMYMLGAASDEMERDWMEFEHEFALEQLDDTDGVPHALREEFRRDQAISAESLAALPPEVREEVEAILTEFQEPDIDPLPNPFTNMNDYGRIMLFVAAPLLLLGLVLSRKRKIWLCLDCGFEQER